MIVSCVVKIIRVPILIYHLSKNSHVTSTKGWQNVDFQKHLQKDIHCFCSSLRIFIWLRSVTRCSYLKDNELYDGYETFLKFLFWNAQFRNVEGVVESMRSVMVYKCDKRRGLTIERHLERIYNTNWNWTLVYLFDNLGEKSLHSLFEARPGIL